MSKRRSDTAAPLPEPVIFIDRNLGAAVLPRILTVAGFSVELHNAWFYGRDNVPDEDIIAECGKRDCVLLTSDRDLPGRYESEIRRAKIAVIVLSNNNDGPKLWGPRIVKARKEILKGWRKRQRPFVAKMSVTSALSFRMLDPLN